MSKIDDRISALEAKLKTIKNQKIAMEQRRVAAEKKREREHDTRRKILIGAMVMDRIDSGKMTEGKLREMLEEFLTRDKDRVLFGLPVPEKPETGLAATAEVDLDAPKPDAVSGV